MTSIQQSIFIFTMIIGLLMLVFLAIRAWQKYLSRGARSFLLMLYSLIGFHAFYLTTNFAATASDRKIVMSMAFAFLGLFPTTWIIMVRELAELDRKKSWRILVPLLALNTIVVSAITLIPGVYEFSHCYSRGGTMVFCSTERSTIWLGLIGVLLVEIIGGAVYLMLHYVKNPNKRERSQVFALVAAVAGTPILTFILILFFDTSLISPMPFAILIAAILMYNAVFNYKLLSLRFSESQVAPMVEDLLLVVNNDHIVQDFNLSTLNVFNMQVRNLVNVQLEHAFIDYPQITNLFNQDRVTGTVELVVNGINHIFEPSMVIVMDQESGFEIGKRLQLQDVTTELQANTTEGNVTRDLATNLYNQESFFVVGGHILSHMREARERVALIVMGIDNVQHLQTMYSHRVIDEILSQVVKTIGPLIEPQDMIARFNDDTLVFLLPFNSTNRSTALEVSSRMKRRISEKWFEYEDESFQLTVSQGYTVYDGMMNCDLKIIHETAKNALEKLQREGVNGLDFISLEKELE